MLSAALIAALHAFMAAVLGGARPLALALRRAARARPARTALAGAVLVVAGLIVWRMALAATITVTTTADTVDGNTAAIAALQGSPGADGFISLREAVTAALNDVGTGPHTVSLPAGTYNLASGVLTIGAAVNLQGASAATTTISAQTLSRVFSLTSSLTLTDLTLSSGHSGGSNGGCITATNGSLTMSGVTLSGCAAPNGAGGAIYATGTTITLSSGTVQSNSSGTGSGGAVMLTDGSLTVTNSTFSSNTASNSGGGAVWLAGTANGSFTDTTFSGNTGNGSGGGGLGFSSSGTLTISGATFANNSGNNGRGGGLYVATGSASASNVTFTGNTNINGGAAVNVASGTLTLTNVTVGGNTATTNGAGGIRQAGGTLSLRNTIVANNTGSGGNCSGTITNTANNIDSGTTCRFGSANGSLSSASANLLALAGNGGPTQTMALGAGSAAINAGTATSAPATDQRGTARSGATDIGAYEYGAASPYTVSGTVFEDVNYGGGAGRSLAASGGSGVNGATVELYDSSGVYVSNTTTAGGGAYSFTALAAGSYHVRVAGSSVASTRSGSTGALRGVLTYRSTASSGAAVAVTDVVGGTDPALADAAAGSSGATFNPATGVYSAVLSGTAQAYAPVTVGSANITGVDFGFNFDTVVNTNDTGQGSLRQAITNANALGIDASLAQSGRAAAIEHLVFMIGNGSSAAGLRSSINFFSAGVATIASASALPTLGTAMVIDAQAQPGWASTPVVRLDHSGAPANDNAFNLTSTGSTLRGLAVTNAYMGISVVAGGSNTVAGNHIGIDAAGSTAAGNRDSGIYITNSTGNVIGGTARADRNVIAGNAKSGIYLHTGAANTVVQGNYIGLNAAGTAAVGNNASLDTNFAGITLNAAGGTQIGGTTAGARNVISGNWRHGIAALGNASNTVVTGNYVGTDASGTAAVGNTNDGMNFTQATTATVGGAVAGAGNVIAGSGASGIYAGNSSGVVIQGNRIGSNAAGTAALPNNRGLHIQANGTQVGSAASGQGNTITGNTGVGVMVDNGIEGVAILGNAVYGNGGQEIDLGNSGLNANDGAKTAGSANLLMDQPVITAARSRGNQVTVTGYVGSAAAQSLFANARVEIFLSDNDSSGYGGGQTYLGFVTTDGSGGFSGTVTMPVATPLAIGNRLTGTATDASGNTSEFGANFTGLIVDFVVNSNLDEVDDNLGDGQCLTASGVCTLRAAIAELNTWSSLATTPVVAFALPSPGAGCVIMPASALPAINRAMVIDAQTQAGWTQAPIVELVGTGAGSTHGLNIAAAGSTVRGLSIGGFGQGGHYAGIYVHASNATIEGNHIGLAADGLTARANGAVNAASGGVHVASGAGIVIGGTTAATRNVLSGNGGAGVWTTGGSATVIGNYIGTDASGSTAVRNQRWGVQLAFGSHQIGGSAAGQGNVISGNGGGATGGVLVGSSDNTIQGNTIGLNVARTTAVPNGDASTTYASGIDVRAGAENVLIGGTAAGEGNVIAGNQGHGVRVMAQTTRVLGNSLYGNTWLGIDLNADGVTANNGTVSGAAPNNGMDHPVITSAGYDGGTRVLTVAGYVGTGTGQSAFAGARIEFFASDADSSGYGEGRDYLGTLTVDGNGRYSGSVTVPGGVSFVVGAAMTATATDTAGNTSEFGPNYTVTTMSALAPSRFNVFETGTASLSLSGVIKTMTAGQATTLAVIVIDQAGTGLAPAFTGSVSLQWMDTRHNGGALDAGGCRSSWVAGASAGTANFSSGMPRINLGFTPAVVGREWRLRMSHTTGNGSVVTACTTDNFAVKPAAIAVTAVGSADSSSAGVGGAARSLTNADASGGVVHRAARPFALRAQGQDAGNALTAGYDGTATIAITACVLPASGCTLGSLQHNGGAASLTATAGALSSDTMSYSEVGAISVRLSDISFADIDAADSTPAERLIQSGDITVGRFVPDRYTTALTTAGVLNTVNAACTAAGASYTFFGQAFGWGTAPQFSVTAQNAQGATTVNWTGSLQRLTPASHVAQSVAVSGVASSLSQSHGSLGLTDLGGGSARLEVQATASFALARDNAAPVASATPVFGWAAAIDDTSEAAVSGNGSITGTATQSGIAFSGGDVFHTGRLALAPAHGDARRGVRLLVELQRYSAAGWVTMTEDRGCVTVSPGNVTVASPQGVFSTWGLCAAPVQAAVTLRGGRGWMSLPATPGQTPGRLTAGLNLAAASSGLACTAVGASAAAAPMNLTHLMGAWGGVATLTTEPRAALTWGRPNRDMVLTRERF